MMNILVAVHSAIYFSFPVIMFKTYPTDSTKIKARCFREAVRELIAPEGNYKLLRLNSRY